jgi:DNA-binding phage protein
MNSPLNVSAVTMPPGLPAPPAAVFGGFLDLEAAESAMVGNRQVGPAIQSTLLALQTGTSPGAIEYSAVFMVPFTLDIRVRSELNRLVVTRLAAKLSVLVSPDDDEAVARLIEDQLGETDRALLRHTVARVRGEYEDMMAAVNQDQRLAVICVADAIFMEARKERRTILQVIADPGLRAHVYAQVFLRGGLEAWKRKAAMIAARAAALPFRQTLAAFQIAWNEDENDARAFLQERLPHATEDQIGTITAVMLTLAARSRDIFPEPA